LNDTFLQLNDSNEGKKKEVRLKSNEIVFTDKLEGNTLLSDSEIAQKSRDSILLIGARVTTRLTAIFAHPKSHEKQNAQRLLSNLYMSI
jgi:hypothetical protein